MQPATLRPSPSDQRETEQRLRASIEHLARLERLPCSAGEREAADWIAARMREHTPEVSIELERVHGTYIWPLGLLCAAAALGGLTSRRRRLRASILGALAAAGIWQDLGGSSRRWFRRLLPHAETANVLAWFGDPDAQRVLVIHAHHDAARTSFLFDEKVPRFVVQRMPWLVERIDRWPPLMGLVVAGPALVALGGISGSRRATRAGTTLAAGAAAVLFHMRTQPVVPGANDNLSGVAVLLELARRLAGEQVEGLRVGLLSAGAEESNQEGMIRFAERHLAGLAADRAAFLCLDTVGSPNLVLIEGEGFLRMREYPAAVKDLVARAASDVCVSLRRGLRFTFATDGLVPLRAGYPAASIGSLNENLVPSNYHSPTDTADRVNYETVADAAALAYRVVELSASLDAVKTP